MGGIFRCGKFRTSNVCEISRSIFRPLCEINPVRKLATPWVLQLLSFQGKLDSQPECYDLQGWDALFVREKSISPSGLPL